MSVGGTWRQLPQPFKTLWWAAIVAFVPMMISVVWPSSGVLRWLSLLFPFALALSGAVLALNVRGNASSLAQTVRREELPGFGAVFVRLVGLAVVVGGAVMVVSWTTGDS